MENLKKNKNIIVAIVLFIVVVFVYTNFFKGEEEADLSKSSEIAQAVPENKDLLLQLQTLGSLKLDTSIFENTVFRVLENNTVILEKRNPEGRANPFSQIGTDSSNFNNSVSSVSQNLNTQATVRASATSSSLITATTTTEIKASTTLLAPKTNN
jgi:hypothetical protein